jgi:hypothetical protein
MSGTTAVIDPANDHQHTSTCFWDHLHARWRCSGRPAAGACRDPFPQVRVA